MSTSRSFRSLFSRTTHTAQEGTMIRSTRTASHFVTSTVLALALLAGCGDYTPQRDCSDDCGCDEGNPALTDWEDCGESEQPTDSGTPLPETDTECTAEEIAAAMSEIPECPPGTFHDLLTSCINGDYIVDATCVEMESGQEPFDCIGAFTLADALCDGTLAFECNATTGFVSSECTPEAAECPSPADVAASCDNGLSSYTCNADGSYSTTCNEPTTEPVTPPECESAEDAADGCAYGLSSYSCDGTTGDVDVECASAPESDCPDPEDVDDLCSNGLSSYTCNADGSYSAVCFESDGGTEPTTETGACDDGIDNEGEGLIDSDDPDCHSDYDATNPATYDAALEEDLYDAGGDMSCCIDMNSDSRCTYTDGSGDIDGGAYTGADLYTYYNVYPSSVKICDEWPDEEDDRNEQDGSHGSYNSGDCNDQDSTIYSGADEVCDGYDNDCDGQTDEVSDSDGDGYDDPGCAAAGSDCDDSSAGTYPGATDWPDDSVDQDCSGSVDDYDYDGDCYCTGTSCNTSSSSTCTTLATGDCNDYSADAFPGNTEYPGDGFDQDCVSESTD